VLLFGEVIPKFLYRKYAFPMTLKSVPALAFFFYLASPVFWVLGAFSKIFGVASGGPRNADVREEILLVAVEGARRGDIFECADRVMKNTLEIKGNSVGAFAVGIGDWKTRYNVYRRSQLLSEFSGDGGPHADEVVVFDDDLSAPVGYVSLMDAAVAVRRGDGALATFGTLVKPLPRLRGGMEALSCLRRMPQNSPRYHLILNGNEATAILDKRALFEAAFAKG
jgi:CBS domain containing-hemolysin-like protein